MRETNAGPPEKWFTFFGLVVVRRTDLLAATAFALSLSTILYQLWTFVRGANPAIYFPDTVYVFFDKYANGVSATRLAGQISFTNTGDTGHNAIIRDVTATIKIADRSIEQFWTSFATVTRRDTELVFDIKAAAHPIVVNGGGAASQLVTFSPRVKPCPAPTKNPCNESINFLSDTDFLKLASQEKEIRITFSGRTFGSGRVIEANCTLSATEDFIQTLAKNDWYASRCVAPR